MTIRIYLLAQQLKRTTKEILEVCPGLGITGKTSALKNLSSEEVAQITEYFSSLDDKEANSSEKPEMIAPTSIPADDEKKVRSIPVIKTRRPGGISRIFGVSNKPPVTKTTIDSKVDESKVEKSDVDATDSGKSVREKGKSQDVDREKKGVTDQGDVDVKVEAPSKARQKKSSSASHESEPIDSGEKVEAKGSVGGSKTRRKKDSSGDEGVTTVDEKTGDSKADENKSSEKGTVGSKSAADVKKVPSIPPAINRRDLKRGSGRGQSKPAIEPRPVRPLPPVYSQPDRTQILEEMKRPPVITPHAGSRVAVLDGNQKKSGAGASSSRSNAGKGSVTIGRLAQLPDAPSRPVAKKPQEQAAQKPVRILTQDVINRARDAGVSVTDVLKTSQRSGRDGSKSKTDGLKVIRRSSEIGTSSSGDFATGGSRKGKNYRDRDVDGQDNRNRKNSNDSRRSRNSFQTSDDDDYGYVARSRGPRQPKKSNVAVTLARVNDIVIETPCTVRDFSEATGIGVATVIKELMKMGMMKTTNQSLDSETIQLLILSFELKATVKEQATLEEQFVDTAFNEVDPPESLVPRAPVVTFLGHVDHGKTSLLDRILHLHVVSGEKGGITQHIRAYRVNTEKGAVTFVDTPGHEAFTEMRARGANCTDVAVLVVAADDGVMPQTEEAISHAKAAGVPIIVALNKMDIPGVKRDKVIQELANNDLTPSEWGGDVEIVETSAVTGMGIDNLLDTILTVAELSELKANPNRAANGVVLEASLQSGEGVVCKALVQNGTLRNGDVVLCGSSYGRVRSMTDTLDSHKRIKEAGPSVPVSLTGLDVAPEAGSKFVVLEDVSIARQIAEERAKRAREIELAGSPSHVTLENLFERMNSAKSQQTLNVIIRADVRGSIEAIRKELSKLEHPEVKVKILQATVGGITEADVYLADASDAIVVGFNVVPDEGARALAEAKKVQIRRYDIIYKLSEDIKAALEGMLKPVEQVKELGRALVKRTFNISRVGVIAGCRVLYGVIERDCQVRVIRDSRIIGEYALDTLKREKDDAKEVREGYECGIKLKNYNDVKEGDILEAYKIEEIARTF